MGWLIGVGLFGHLGPSSFGPRITMVHFLLGALQAFADKVNVFERCRKISVYDRSLLAGASCILGGTFGYVVCIGLKPVCSWDVLDKDIANTNQPKRMFQYVCIWHFVWSDVFFFARCRKPRGQCGHSFAVKVSRAPTYKYNDSWHRCPIVKEYLESRSMRRGNRPPSDLKYFINHWFGFH